MSLKMFVAVDNTNTFFSDNPYYFYNDKQSPRTPDSASSSNKGFSIFKRRNSKGNSPQVLIPEQMRLINSGNLDSAATMALGSPRGSFGSSLSQQSFELQPMKQRRRSSNSQSETFRERIGSYNESSTCSISPSIIEQEDVFQLSPSKHHHTLPSTGTRRHSFGTWRQTNERHKQPNTVLGMGKRIGRGVSATLMDETTKVMVPRAPILSPSKYHGSHRRKDNCGTMNSYYNMDDILIVTAKHSERAILRANFLKNHFDKITKQRGRKPFNFLHIKIEDGPFSEEIANKYQNTALQIIILCPALLALSDSFLMSQLSAIIRSEKVMAILLDVSEEKVKEMHKTALPNYNKWRHCSIRDNDQAQISNILGIATDILGRALCQRPPCQDTSITRSYSSCSEGFTVLPKKVKVGQNKVVVMLTEPLEKDDIVKVVVEKSGELIEIRNFKYRNPFTLQLTIPESCMEISTMVELRIEKNNKSLGARPIKCESRLRELEQLLRIEDSPIEFMCHALGIGPTERDELDLHLLESFQRNMPPNFHLLNGPYEKQHHFLNIRNTRPEEYPTMLHFAARWGLNRLCIQLLECPGGDTACGIRNCVGKTPAELAEQEGHHKLAQNIVSFSEFHELTTMYHYFKGISGGNNNQLQCTEKSHAGKIVLEPFISKPSKTQKSQKTVPLAQPDEYMEMSSGSERENTPEVKSKTDSMAISNLNYISVETEDENLQGSPADIYKNLDSNKVLTTTEEETNEMCVSEPPYYASKEKNVSRDVTDSNCQSDKFSQECSQLLENCSIGSTSNDYILQPSNVPVNIKSVNNDAYDDGNYLFQPSNRPVDAEYLIPQSREQPKCHSSKGSLNQPIYGSLKRTPSDGSNSIRSNADDELAEIMHDFKNNVLSIREVEVLVEKWKHRNDVQQSFREKQDQIELLRKEYDRVQEQIRNKLKRETPLDKIKKLFSRHKSAPHLSSSDKHSGADSVLDDTKSSLKTSSSFKSTSNRPMSTLSLHSISSSASSGRLSTGSNCSGTSLGDSGTHSDHEERRFGCRLGSPGSLIDNYLVPPPPRPVFTPNSTPGDERHQIVFPSPLAPCQRLPSSPSANMEHYQMFPSNIPVYSTQSLSSSQSNNYLNTIMEAKENEQQYQNGVTLQPIKVNERANIIYGKLVKNTPNCSSFKPKQVAAPQVATVEVEVYQNVGDNLDCDETDAVESTKPNQTTDVESETTNKSIETDNDHNYMNC